MFSRSMRSRSVGVATAMVGLLAAGTAWAAEYDARVEYNKGFSLQMSAPQAALVGDMRSRVPNFEMTWDQTLGVVGSVSSWTTFLTAPAQGEAPMTTAMSFVNDNLAMLGLSPEDMTYRVTDVVPTEMAGATHLYME